MFAVVVGRSLATGALVCVLMLGAVAAPALSLRPWRPEPVDFTLAPGTGALLGHSSARGAGVVSKPLRTQGRFNLVGISWAGAEREPGVALRTRKSGGPWSRWITVYAHAGDGPDPGAAGGGRHSAGPVWAGEAEWVQYRLSERLPHLRLHLMNLRGTATPADRALSAVRRTASAGVASFASLLRVAGAHGAEPPPPIVPRAAWGAADCPPRRSPDYGEVRAAFVHHTVNSNDYTREEASSVVLGICRFHRNTNGWNDIGYNFLVDRFGTIYEGRAGGLDQAVVGAQAEGYNAQSTGIAQLGTFTSVRQTPEALRATARLIRWKLPLHGVPTAGTSILVSAGGSSNRFPTGQSVALPRIVGHRDTGATSCPGEALYAQLPELRRLVGNLGPSGIATRLEARLGARRRTVRFGATVPVTGRLSVADGAPLAGQTVDVQALIGLRWRTVAKAITAAQGDFSAQIKPMRNRSLRSRFAGAGDLRAATSPRFNVGVRPIVSIARTARRSSSGSRVVVSGRVKPRKPRVYQVLQLRRGRGFRTVGTKALRVRRSGRFRGWFVPARAGIYRFYVVARADRSTARSASAKYTLRASPSRGGGAAAD